MPTYLLDPDVCFLNHGSFGATPLELLQVQDQFRLEMEREPIDFLARSASIRLNRARLAAAAFLGADPEGLVFVQNATAGVNAVLSSLDLGAGDAILTTNHRYDAVRYTLDRWASERGATVVEAQVPFPLSGHDEVLAAIDSAWTDQVRLVVIDQITSPTALIMPVREVVHRCRARDVPVLIDGAHAPGQLSLDLDSLGADFWVGNFHKWLCAPKGTAVLSVAEGWRDRIHPCVTSHGYRTGLHAEFDWCGTFDPTPWLTTPAALALHEEQGGASFRAAHHALVRAGREVIADALGVALPHPDDERLYGSMATIPLPMSAQDIPDLFEALRNEDHIEVPIIDWRDEAWVRISGFAGYNRPEQYIQLADALSARLRD